MVTFWTYAGESGTTLKPEPLLVEPSGVPGQRTIKKHKPSWLVLVQPWNTATNKNS